MTSQTHVFPDPKVGDEIAIPVSQTWGRHPPMRRTIARVTPTRVEDSKGAVWRRDNGRRVGERDGGTARPWTDKDTAMVQACAKFDELRESAGALDAALRNGLHDREMTHAQGVIDAIALMLGKDRANL